MSNTRSSSRSSAAGSLNSALRQSSGCREGASRLPSRMPVSDVLMARARSDRVESLLETIGVRALGLRERLEPVGDLGEPFFARLLRHARVHVAVFVRFARDRGLEIQLRLADRQTRRGIT